MTKQAAYILFYNEEEDKVSLEELRNNNFKRMHSVGQIDFIDDWIDALHTKRSRIYEKEFGRPYTSWIKPSEKRPDPYGAPFMVIRKGQEGTEITNIVPLFDDVEWYLELGRLIPPLPINKRRLP